MALKVCKRGHLTGTRTCWCRADTDPGFGPPQRTAMDKRVKREVVHYARMRNPKVQL